MRFELLGVEPTLSPIDKYLKSPQAEKNGYGSFRRVDPNVKVGENKKLLFCHGVQFNDPIV